MFQPGSVIAGRYQVVRLVGQGGMSNLYLCYDRKYSNATVVVKEMTASYSDPKEQQMAVDLFHREAKLLASLNHRHIPKVYDYFQYAGKYYLSMEFIDGEDLAQKLEATKGPLPERQVLEWGEQIATVLFYLHKHEPPIVFRDVKPSNIMLCDQGVKLIDFGIARHFDQAKKGDTMRIGSPGYAPPEQYAAQTDPRSDIYALGVTLHHALTGRDPTGTQTPFLVPPAKKLNPALSDATSAMLARATQLDPSDRYQSVLEMKKDIKQILNRGKQSTRVVGAPPTPPTPPVPAAGQPPGPTSAGSAIGTGSSPTGQAPAASAPGAVAGQAGPPGPHQPAAGSLVAAASSGPLPGAPAGTAAQSGTGPVSPPAPQNPSQGGAKGSWLWWIAAAMVVVLGVGVSMLTPQQRQTVWTSVQERAAGLAERFEWSDDGTRGLRQALASGDPGQLISALDSPELESLSPEAELVYQLNLLALEAGENRKRLVHLLYPESAVGTALEQQIFVSVSAALSALNGIGGSRRTLLVCSPQTYRPDRLQSSLEALESQAGAEPSSVLLIRLDGPDVEANGQVQSSGAPAQSVTTLELGTTKAQLIRQGETVELPVSLGDVIRESRPDLDWEGISWGAAEPPPEGLTGSPEGDSTGPADRLRPDAFSSLAGQAREQGRRLLLESYRLPDSLPSLEGTKLLLYAVTPFELPNLPPDTDAEALVLWDPLQGSLTVPVSTRKFALTPTGALLRDLLILEGSSSDPQPYRGLGLRGERSSLAWRPTSATYRWVEQAWLPNTDQKDEPR